MSDIDCRLKSYRVGRLPAGVFGENYAVVAAVIEPSKKSSWECYFLSKRPAPNLRKTSCEFAFEPESEVMPIDFDFLFEDAKSQLEVFIYSRLEQLAEERSNEAILEYIYELVEMDSVPLHSLWARGEFQKEVNDIAESTKCTRLKRYLDLLVQSRVIRRPG